MYGQLCARWERSPALILVTAQRDEQLRAIVSERGWGYLLKPIRPPALRSLMTQLLLRQAS